MTRVRQADVQNRLAVVLCQDLGFLDSFEKIRLHEVASAEDFEAGSVSFQDFAVLVNLRDLGFEHVHQTVYFVLGALKVLDTECVDRHDFHARFVADFENLGIWGRLRQLGLLMCQYVLCASCRKEKAYPH